MEYLKHENNFLIQFHLIAMDSNTHLLVINDDYELKNAK